MTAVQQGVKVRGGVGESVIRHDAVPKVRGEFAFSNDYQADGMLYGATLRSPHASARILSINVAPALAIIGVSAVLTAADVPGRMEYGLEHPDQPVFASEIVRFHGEPIAIVAADHPDRARQACAAIVVEYEIFEPVTDPEIALVGEPLHPNGNVFKHMWIRRGDQTLVGEVTVEGTYEVGMQDQAFLGPEAALAVPDEDGGVTLHVATQFLHVDRDQTAAALNLSHEKVRLVLAGVGGAFGAREDVSLQIHTCLLALRTGRPVKMQYSREESFFGHVHRHPAKMWYRHHASRDGTLVRVEARLVLDGGAYASTSAAVLTNAVCFSCGPYKVPSATIEGLAVRTNNPTCGAMRGFGAVQACFAHEAQMDKLALALGMDPIDLRLHNALAPGDSLITGQVLTGATPVAEVIRTCAAAVSGEPSLSAGGDMMARPGGAGRTADERHIRRGTGFAVSIKNLMFSDGFDDYSVGRCTIDSGVVIVKSACAEVGQGFVTLAAQIARSVLGVEHVIVDQADTTIGSAGSTSASRQTWMSGGAIELACRAVLADILADVAADNGVSASVLTHADGRVRSLNGDVDVAMIDHIATRQYEREVSHHHQPTDVLDENGQGNGHVSFAFAAHCAVVDVDRELGLVRVVNITTSQDVGKIMNPLQALGQIEGGIAQGVGLAVMEEIIVERGRVRNPSFTDYLIPTALDMPTVTIAALIEEPEPGAPFGAKGIGEPPTISSTAAVVAAIRNATGLELPRTPVRPQDIALDPTGYR